MQNYRDGSAEFRQLDTQVLGISVDASPSLRVFAEQNGVTFPLLSDFKREVSAKYGLLNEERGYANRATLVVDKQGKIAHIEAGRTAIEIAGALSACKAIK
jgi:peroxiredoxin (alkyl hydroperoxide reductase subunit C)